MWGGTAARGALGQARGALGYPPPKPPELLNATFMPASLLTVRALQLQCTTGAAIAAWPPDWCLPSCRGACRGSVPLHAAQLICDPVEGYTAHVDETITGSDIRCELFDRNSFDTIAARCGFDARCKAFVVFAGPLGTDPTINRRYCLKVGPRRLRSRMMAASCMTPVGTFDALAIMTHPVYIAT